MSEAFCTNWPTFSTASCPAGTTSPWYACGVMTPVAVRKEMSTTASVAVGSDRARVKVLAPVVDPPAKDHWGPACDAQGAVLQPPGPPTTWDATTPPPAKTNEEALLAWPSPLVGSTATVSKAGTSTERWTVGAGPVLTGCPMLVIMPATVRGVVLVR